jgi:hypothetical protein
MMKKFVSCLLSAVLVFSVFQMGILQASAEISGDYNYTVVNNSTVTINYYLGEGGVVKIPAEIGGYPVTVIGMQAFSSQSAITGVSIPNTVTLLSQEAFKGCINLTRVTIPASVAEIQMHAFKDCSNLAKVYFLGNAPIMGVRPFEGCKAPSIFRVYYMQGNSTFPATWIGFTTVAFTPLSTAPAIGVDTTSPTNSNVTVTVTYPNTDEALQEYRINNGTWTVYTVPLILSANATVYARCSDSTGISGSTVSRYIGNIAVNGIVYSILGNNAEVSVTGYIGSGGALTIPATLGGLPVTDIGISAFQNKTLLTGVVIPDTVTNISQSAFYGCSGLTSVTIGKNVSVIGTAAFQNCSNLVQVNIPDKVWSLGQRAFMGCSGLTKAVVGNSVESISLHAFRDCVNLTRVILPDNLKSITSYAFNGCVKIKNIVIPDKTTYVGQEAFKGCSLLANAYFMGNAPTMDTLVFDSCAVGFKVNYISTNSGFTPSWYTWTTIAFTPLAAPEIVVSTSEPVTGIVEVTVNFPSGKADNYQNKEVKLSGGSWELYSEPLILTVRKTVSAAYTDLSGKPSYRSTRNIDNVFNDFTVVENSGKLTITRYIGSGGSVIVPAELDRIPVVAIADNAFNSFPSVTEVTIAEGVTSIGESAFYGCSGMQSVTLPGTLTTIGNNAFYGCYLGSVSIPKSVLSIGRSAFSACSGLNHIFVDDENPNYADIDGVLFNKGGTSLIQFPAGSAEEYTVPAGVTFIAKYAFANSPELYSVTIPAAVTTVSEYAFENCPNLTIYCTAGSAARDYAAGNGIPYVLIGVSLAEVYCSGTVVDRSQGFIYGLHTAMTKAQFESDKVQINGDGHLSYTPENSGVLGTGTIVNVTENLTGTVWETYHIVVFGDVNGDGNIDSADAGVLVDYENYLITWDTNEDASFVLAGDVNADGNVDSSDAGIIVDYENYIVQISQNPFAVIEG